MLVKDAKKVIGCKCGLGCTTKTGLSYGLPARATCKVGDKLSKIKGSTCYGCYARGGTYTYPSTKQAHANRLDVIQQLVNPETQEKWVDAMVFLINRTAEKNMQDLKYFRWHDSGDIINLEHLESIVKVAGKTPNIKHWLPTKEISIVKAYLKKHKKFPDNLTVRMSCYFIDEITDFKMDLPIATVYKREKPKGVVCQAILQHKGCKEVQCRKCWNKNIPVIAYKYHK